MAKDFEVEADQVFLIKNALRLLNPKGTLYFSNNKRKFKLDDEIKSLAKVTDITAQTIPMDFRDAKVHQCYKIEI